MTELSYMQRAFELAKLAAEQGEVPVGAVIVDPDINEIIAEGHNQPISSHDPTAHAEIVAIRAAATQLENYRTTGLHLYVTLEPCAMCAGAISQARIGRVIFAASDEKGGAVKNGVKFFDQPTCHWHPDVTEGPMADECSDLLRSFFRERRKPSASTTHQIEGSASQSE